jgi:hypothetical protein
MRVGTFLLYTTLGSLIWNTTFVMAGYVLGENWHTVEAYAGTFQNVVIAAYALAMGYFVVTRLMKTRRDRPATGSGALGAGMPEPHEPAGHVEGRSRDGAAPLARGSVYGTPRRPEGDR